MSSDCGTLPDVEALLAALERFYGALPTPPRDPFAFFVWEVLSMQTTAGRRDAAMNALKRIPALTPDSMSRAPQKKLESALTLAGPYLEQRLRALRTGVDLFRRSPRLPAVIKGRLSAARRALRSFPQIGETGAHRMLLFAADYPVLPTDAALARVGRRLGYGGASGLPRASARSVRRALAAQLPPSADARRRAFLYLSHHGAATCTEADPHCVVCPLLKECPEGNKRLS